MSAEERLEERLRGLRPRRVSEELVERVGASVVRSPWTWPERVAAMYLGLGMAAGLYIAGTVVWEVMRPVEVLPARSANSTFMAQQLGIPEKPLASR